MASHESEWTLLSAYNHLFRVEGDCRCLNPSERKGPTAKSEPAREAFRPQGQLIGKSDHVETLQYLAKSETASGFASGPIRSPVGRVLATPDVTSYINAYLRGMLPMFTGQFRGSHRR